jgi:hypothetical protein
VPKLALNFEEILSRAHFCFEEQLKVLDCAINIVNYCFIINVYCKYIINAYGEWRCRAGR